MSTELKKIIEALLFVSDTPMGEAQLAQLLEEHDKEAVRAALAELRDDYERLGRAFHLVEVAGGFMFRTRPQMAFWLKRLKRQQVTRLSRAALETLAIVAYKQPVLKAEIERVRGVEVGGILKTLIEKNLIRVAGRRDLPGRPLVYATTRRFLEVFDLKDLGDLPTLAEIDALAEEPGLGVEAQAKLDFAQPEDAEGQGQAEPSGEGVVTPLPSGRADEPEPPADDPDGDPDDDPGPQAA